jgi:hypothetical protein
MKVEKNGKDCKLSSDTKESWNKCECLKWILFSNFPIVMVYKWGTSEKYKLQTETSEKYLCRFQYQVCVLGNQTTKKLLLAIMV